MRDATRGLLLNLPVQRWPVPFAASPQSRFTPPWWVARKPDAILDCAPKVGSLCCVRHGYAWDMSTTQRASIPQTNTGASTSAPHRCKAEKNAAASLPQRL